MGRNQHVYVILKKIENVFTKQNNFIQILKIYLDQIRLFSEISGSANNNDGDFFFPQHIIVLLFLTDNH